MAVAAEPGALRAVLEAAAGADGPVPEALLALEETIASFLSRPSAVHTAAEVGQQIVHLVRCVDQLRLEAARLTGVFAATD
ncbi:MAG: hypothetical protein ABR598_09125, partial [Candidatus Dormibacteria bacterium]